MKRSWVEDEAFSHKRICDTVGLVGEKGTYLMTFLSFLNQRDDFDPGKMSAEPMQSSNEIPTEQNLLGRRTFLSKFAKGAGCACAVGAGLASTGCVSTNLATGRQSFTGFQSLEDDVAIGRREHPKLVKQFGGEYENPRLQRYVDEIGRKTAQFAEYEFPYKFTIVNSPIVNAFALPGGFIYLSRGLLALASSEAEVAGVISHEIGHVTARHTAERISQSQLAQLGVGLLGVLTRNQSVAQGAGQVAGLVLRGHSRDQELEADTLGMRYMSRAGYDPDGSVTFLESLREHSIFEARRNGKDPNTVDQSNLLATHPRTIERVRAAQARADAVAVENAVTGRNEHFDQINGILYGDDPKEGVIEGRRFTHGQLRFTFEVPPGFTIRNGSDQVVASNGEGAGIIFDMESLDRRESLSRYVGQIWAGSTQVGGLERLTINGIEAATGLARGRNKAGADLDMRALAIRGDGDRIFRFLFVSPVTATSSLSEGYRRTTYSFKRLTQSQASKVKGMRLITAPVFPGDTVASLSRSMPFGKFNEEAFRVLNDLASNEVLTRGRMVKIIVS